MHILKIVPRPTTPATVTTLRRIPPCKPVPGLSRQELRALVIEMIG